MSHIAAEPTQFGSNRLLLHQAVQWCHQHGVDLRTDVGWGVRKEGQKWEVIRYPSPGVCPLGAAILWLQPTTTEDPATAAALLVGPAFADAFMRGFDGNDLVPWCESQRAAWELGKEFRRGIVPTVGRYQVARVVKAR